MTQRTTLNAQRLTFNPATLCIGRWTLDVGRWTFAVMSSEVETPREVTIGHSTGFLDFASLQSE
jgi:hypothetical protein